MPSATTAESRDFDRAQDRDGDGIREDGPHLGEVEGGERRRRQGPRQLAKATAHGGDIEMQEKRQRRGDRDRDQQPRPFRPQAPQTENDGDGEQRQRDRRRFDCPDMFGDGGDLGQQGCRLVRDVEAQQILQLAGENDDRNSGREANDDRQRDVLDIGAEPQEADRDHHRAGHQRRQHQAVVAVPLDDIRDQDDEGAGRSADLKPAAAQGGDKEAADDRGVQSSVRRQSRADGDGHRERQRHDGDGQSGDGVGAERAPAVAFAQDGDELRREQFGEGRGRGLRPSGRGRIHGVYFLQERRRDRQAGAAP